MNAVFSFSEVARLPMPGDNVAIATRRLEAGHGHRLQRPAIRVVPHGDGRPSLCRRAD